LNCYYLLYAVLGEFESDLDHRQAALNYFQKALELTTIKSEQTFFTKKLRELNIAHANGARRAHQRSEHP
jgi:RNA polymerase sigma-70 factor (ECF subfamily)